MNSEFFSNLVQAFPVLNGALLVGLIGLTTRTFIANRKLTISENTGLRAEFIGEMHELRSEVKDLRVENENLRKEVRELHGVIDGMRREALSAHLSQQAHVLREMPDLPPGTRKALERLDQIRGVGE